MKHKTKVPQKRDFVYGWVSKYREIKFPYTILLNLSTTSKNFLNNFINIFIRIVDYRKNGLSLSTSILLEKILSNH